MYKSFYKVFACHEALIGFEAKKFLLEKIYQDNITALKNLQLKNNLCRYAHNRNYIYCLVAVLNLNILFLYIWLNMLDKKGNVPSNSVREEL